jgi:prepilin-type N-terminal cleavage/methylation domain-containing protein
MREGTLNNQNGMTLVEVVAAIAILSIILLTFGGALINNMSYTTATTQKLSTLQLANNVLKKYEEMSYSDAQSQIGTSKTLDPSQLSSLLNNNSTSADQYQGFDVIVTLSNPDDVSLSNYLVKVQVKVTSTLSKIQNTTELEGYVHQ